MHIQLTEIACSGICGGCFMNLLFSSFPTGPYIYYTLDQSFHFAVDPHNIYLPSLTTSAYIVIFHVNLLKIMDIMRQLHSFA